MRAPSVSTVTPAAATLTPLTLTPVRTPMPRREKVFAIWAETSSSSTGRMRGSASSSVTWTP